MALLELQQLHDVRSSLLDELAEREGRLDARSNLPEVMCELAFALSASLHQGLAADGAQGGGSARMAGRSDAALNALASDRAFGIVVADEVNQVRLVAVDGRQSERKAFTQDVTLRGRLFSGGTRRAGIELPTEQARLLATLLGESDFAHTFCFVPLGVEYHSPLAVGIGYVPCPRSATTPLARGRQVRTVLLLLATIAKDLDGFIRHAALREEAFHAGLQQEGANIGLDLHDSLLQDLSYMQLQLGRLRLTVPPTNERAKSILQDLSENMRRVARQTRQLSLELTAIEQKELVEAIGDLIERSRSRFSGDLELTVRGKRRPVGKAVTWQLLRILQEALNNVWKHAAASRVAIELAYEVDQLELRVSDNGRGFEQSDQEGETIGLVGMRRRAAQIGGRIAIESRAGEGTSVRVQAPG